MTLILATVFKQGAVLVADRRTLVSSRTTGEQGVLTDEAEKLFVVEGLAMGVVGHSKRLEDSAEKVVSDWLRKTFDSKKDIEIQLRKLYSDKFSTGKYGYFIAAYSDKEGTTIINTWKEFEVYKKTNPDRFKIKFFGSGNMVGSALVEKAHPVFESFDIDKILNFSAEIIEHTHDELEKDKAKINGVGRNVMAAVVTPGQAKLLQWFPDK